MCLRLRLRLIRCNLQDDVEELEGSELGTLHYWDDAYRREIENFKNHGDVGEIWFGEDAELRIINWMLSSDLITFDDNIIDIGCGNGMMLIELAREGFTNLTGIDYSQAAVELAQAITEKQHLNIDFLKFDIVTKDISNLGPFKIVHDKGTYDAISLCPDDTKTKRLKYIENVFKLLGENGLLILTSCNWTESELVKSFKGFELVQVIPTPSFKFAGKSGSLVTSVVFKKMLTL